MAGMSFMFAALYVIIAEAQVLTTYFTQPPDKGPPNDYTNNPVYSLTSNLKITWVTFLDSYSIYLWQQSLTEHAAYVGLPIFTKALGQAEPGATTWAVSSQNFNLQISNVFFLSLGPNQTLISAQTCHYFNFTAVAETTSSASSSTTGTLSGASGATASSASATSVATIPTTPFSSASSSHGNNLSVKLGIGIGVGIGVPLTALVPGFFVWGILRKWRPSKAVVAARDNQDNKFAPNGGFAPGYGEGRTELPASWDRTMMTKQQYTEGTFCELPAND